MILLFDGIEKKRNEIAVKLLQSKNGVGVKDNVGMATPKLSDSIFYKSNDVISQTTTENVSITLNHIQNRSKDFKVW